MNICNAKFKHIKSNVSITIEYILNYYATLFKKKFCVCMDKCIVIIFCNCVQNFCSVTGHISVYLYNCTWPLTINFADIPIYILSWVWVKLSWVGNKYVTVFEWYRRFCDGSRSLGDEKGPGRNGSAFSGRNVSYTCFNNYCFQLV